jgi:hypothetical protein
LSHSECDSCSAPNGFIDDLFCNLYHVIRPIPRDRCAVSCFRLHHSWQKLFFEVRIIFYVVFVFVGWVRIRILRIRRKISRIPNTKKKSYF